MSGRSHTPNAETIAAIEEGEEMLKHTENYPSYNSASELFAAVLGDKGNIKYNALRDSTKI